MTSADVLARVVVTMTARFPRLTTTAGTHKSFDGTGTIAWCRLYANGKLSQHHEARAATPGQAAGALAKSLCVNIDEAAP